MKKRIALLLLLVVGGAAAISFAGATPGEKPAVDPEVSQMQNEISDLKAKLQTLEGQVQSLESIVAQLKQPHLTPLIVPQPNPMLLIPPIESKPPKIWGEREINGWTFYIVPCDQKTP
jgi:hypothetical protein